LEFKGYLKERIMATGTYHKFNYLMFRILGCLLNAYSASVTCKEIADNEDIGLKKVQKFSGTRIRFQPAGT